MKGHDAMFYLPMIVSLSIVFLLPLTNKKFRTRLSHDPVEAIMFGVAIMLTLALLFSAAMVTHAHDVALLKITALAIGAFAVVGIVLGLVRNLLGKGATKETDRAN